MRIAIRAAAVTLAALALTACGERSPETGKTETGAGETAPAAAPGDHAALLAVLDLAADADGRVVNECGEAVEPGFFPVELGGPVGAAELLVIPGGPTTLTCYGDGPGALYLMKPEGDSYRMIFADRGYLAILEPGAGGARELSVGGPGFSFPVFAWDGAYYAPTDRTISDGQLADAEVLP